MVPRDIGWAVDRIHEFRAVRRPHWATGFYVRRHDIDLNGRVERMIIMHFPDGHFQPFTCHHDDLLATDWQLA